MKITGIELSSDDDAIFRFGLGEVSQTEKFFTKRIIGLDADEIFHKFHGTAKASGSKFFNFSLPNREIVMRIVLNPNYSINESVSDIRDNIMRAIAASRTGTVRLLFTASGAAVATLSGFITKLEVPYFSEESELQITIKCDDPIFRGFSPTILESSDLGSTNPILVADSQSTAPHGFTMQCTFTDTVTEFTISDDATTPEWEFKITPNTAFESGDILYLSSEHDKSLYVDDGVSITHLMDRIEPGSIWPLVFPGSNIFHFDAIADFTWDHLTHYPAYWGV